MKLVIVESPGKVKKIASILGDQFTVRASVGHICDLPEGDLGIDLSSSAFQEHYVVLPGKDKIVQDLSGLARRAEMVYLATDPDREGEAIAWHIANHLPQGTRTQRITFNAITHDAVLDAFKAPRPLNDPLIHAQRTRRVIDRLVGYQVSKVLADANIPSERALSAGRVQTATLALLVGLELERRNFVARSYWTLTAHLQHPNGAFVARLQQPAQIPSQQDLSTILNHLRQASLWWIRELIVKEDKQTPPAPFTTSSMQQEASKRLKFKPKQTDRAAQALYEAGLITYIRTDSVAVAPEAQAKAREVITTLFSSQYVPETIPTYSTNSASAQEAHEAIRPTKLELRTAPANVELTDDARNLYGLIWNRFIASQMSPARFLVAEAHVQAGLAPDRPLPYPFLARARQRRFDGYQVIYTDPTEEDDEPDDTLTSLPRCQKGDSLALRELEPKESKTKPPRPFTQARLIAHMERVGIGRPSTYSHTIETLLNRGYAEMKKHHILPTPLGEQVLAFLMQYFTTIFDIGFTAQMEQQLDQIAAGNQTRRQILLAFYERLTPALQAAQAAARQRLEASDNRCPECKSPLMIRRGKYGPFYGCTRYPLCSYARPVKERADGKGSSPKSKRRSAHRSARKSAKVTS